MTSTMRGSTAGEESGPSRYGVEGGPGDVDAEKPPPGEPGATIEEQAAKTDEPPKDPQAERVAARIAIAKRAELRAAEERKSQASEREVADKLLRDLALQRRIFHDGDADLREHVANSHC